MPLPFVGEERTRILLNNGYDLEKIRSSTPDEIASLLNVSKYIAYLIIKAANELEDEEIPDELVAKETICPKCGNVITELEYECGKCGYQIKSMDLEEYEKSIAEYVNVFVALAKNPQDVSLWEKLQELYESLGNMEEALDVSLRIDLLKDEGFSAEDTRDEDLEKKPEIPLISAAATTVPRREKSEVSEKPDKKTRFKNGLVNGFGVRPSRREHAIRRSRFFVIGLVAVIILAAFAVIMFYNPPYVVDGRLVEWSSVKSYGTFDDSISTLKLGEYGDYYYFEVGGTIDLNSGLDILVDNDADASTGFSYGSLGLEYRISIYKSGSSLGGTIYRFESNDTHDWRGWKSVGGVKVAGGSKGVELRVPKDILFTGSLIQVINGYHSTAPIGLFRPVLVGEMKVGGGVAKEGTRIGTLYLNNTYVNAVDVRGLEIENMGRDVRVDLYANGEVIGSGSTGEYIELSRELRVERSVEIEVYYAGGAQNGTKLMPRVGSILGLNVYSYSMGDGYYVGAKPAKPEVDGVYVDWAPYRSNDTRGDAAPNEDIVSFAKYVDEGESYYYLQTRGEIASGVLIPVQSSGPKDSDRDGVPDSEDPYPHDFNNDGIPDDESYVVVNGNRVPDVDGDGIPDYPHGEDYWLNTTIPDSDEFPAEYRGKEISVYIGPPKGAEPIYPYDYIEVYVSGNEGYEIGGIKAQYLFRLYGQGGRILGHEYYEYENGKFVKKGISFDESRDLAQGWDRLEMRLPIDIRNREVLYRVVSYGDLYVDMAHEPFAKSVDLNPDLSNSSEMNTSILSNSLGNSMVILHPDDDRIAGAFARILVDTYYDEVDLNELTAWISSLDLEIGDERTHVFTGADFVDGNVSHFKEEDYAALRMKEIIQKEGMRPIYRVELLNESIFREEWTNLTTKTKNWEILHWVHDLEELRTVGRNYDNPYILNWYDEKQIRTLEWMAYKLSSGIDDWHFAFEIAKGIKSIDDAMIGPFLAVYPSKEARLTDWSTRGSRAVTHTVTFQLVRWYSGTSDCNGDNDGYVKITLGSWVYTTAVRDDDDSWNAKVIVTNSNNTGTTAYVRIENWEDDSALCGDDDNFGSATFTYYITTKTWSGASTTPYVHTSGGDGSADDWFVIESDDDNEAKLGIYDSNGGSDPMYGGICFNDPWDSPTRVTYYSGANYWGYGIYAGSYYEFYVPAGVSISVHMQPSSYNYDLYLYDPSGNQKASSTNAGNAEDAITFTADSSGYWKIMIYASGGQADWFRFWFTSGPDDKDFVDISSVEGVSDAGYLISNYGGYTYYDSSDQWKFYVPSSWISSGAYIYFWMKPNPNANFDLTLYDPGGNTKATSTNTGLGQVDYILYQLQSSDSAGYWYVDVHPGSSSDYGNYTLFVWCGYKVEFHAVTENAGTHTPMSKNNGVEVSYELFGSTSYVYPNDEEYWIVYVDRGSSYSYAAESNLSNDAAGHRWISQSPPSGTITSSTSIYGYYYEQFYLTIQTAYDTGYSSGKYFGADQQYSNPGSGWYDAGCTVQIWVDSPVNSGGKQYQFVSWSGTGTGSYSGPNNPASFTIQDVTTETANWNEVPEFSNIAFLAPLLIIIAFVRRRR